MDDSKYTRIVKASFRKCSLKDRKKFPSSSCIVPISVGQPVHENKKLSATLSLINDHFKICTLLVDDSIQRHTLKIADPHLSEKRLYEQAIEAGDNWLERNKKIYSCLTIPNTIMRWDDWVNMPNYTNSYEIIKTFYDTNEKYQDEIHESINEYLSRYFSKQIDFPQNSHQQAFTNCLDYLLEECAVMLLWAEQHYDFEVYPAGRNRAMAATHQYIIEPKYPEVLKSVALRFKKYTKSPSKKCEPMSL